MTTDLMCLDCTRPLSEAAVERVHYLRCACGVEYTIQLVEQADRALWERAAIGRLFIRDTNGYLILTGRGCSSETPTATSSSPTRPKRSAT